jgi:hypothetical protein
MASRPAPDGPPNRMEVVEEIREALDKWFVEANRLAGRVFRTLNEGLRNDEVVVICGVSPTNNRVYERFVRPREAKSHHAGRCKSREWFDSAPEDQRCPLRSECGAYSQMKA